MTEATPRIAIIVQQPLSQRDVRRFGVSAMIARGYAVTIIDVADLTFPMLPNTRGHYADFSGFDVSVIRTRSDLEACSSLLAQTAVNICYVGSGYVPSGAWRILRALSAVRTPYLMAAPSTPAFFRIKNTEISFLKRLFRRSNPLVIINSILARVPLRLLGIRPPDFLVIPALRTDLKRPLFAGRSNQIPAHIMDYDLYLEEMSQPERPQNIAVFIDQHFGYHADTKSMGVDWFPRDAFYAQLRGFFDKIERELGLEVIVAVHPRAKYEEAQNLFGGRRLVSGQTISLIRNGRLVITATSAAVLQAILFRKPILFYSTRDIAAHPFFSTHIQDQARYFGAEPVLIDACATQDIASFIYSSDRIYDSCLRDWMRHPQSAEKPYWDIVLDSLYVAGVLPSNNQAAASPALGGQ